MKFDVIYADPPWQFNSRRTGGSMKSGATQVYKTMTIEDLKRMPVPELAADDCYLVMWWVGAMPDEALALMRSWGFRIQNMNGVVWGKLTVTGKLVFGMGHTTRAGTESCLIGVKGKPKPFSRSERAFFQAKIGEHSAKPEEAREKVERIFGPYARKVELFHRGEGKGNWTVFGNQSYPSIILDEYGFREPVLAELQMQKEEVERWKMKAN
ncbi:TPA: adenine methylase [Vibrio harveyi]|nr:adenine methylase [Vibrio harveyi]